MNANQYTPGSQDISAGLERNFVPQSDAEVRKLLKKIHRQHKESLRQEEEIATLLRFMCFAILRSYEREDTRGLDYAAMMCGLVPHEKKKKRRTSLSPWLSYDGR